MKKDNLSSLGGLCSILVGISYLVLGGLVVVQLPELRAAALSGNTGRYLELVAQNPTGIIWENIVYALGATLALVVVQAISAQVRSEHEGWIRWATTLAVVGFVVTLVSSLRTLALEPGRAAAYVAGDAATRAAIVADGLMRGQLDPQTVLQFGAIGFWVLVMNLLMLRDQTLPRLVAYIGIALASGYGITTAGFVLHRDAVVTVGAGLAGVILAPIWYIWTGVILRRGNP